jgi:hypothetical protein
LNLRPPGYEPDELPGCSTPRQTWWRGMDSNHRRLPPTDLQSAPFNRSGTPPNPELAVGLEPTTCGLQIRCATLAPRQRKPYGNTPPRPRTRPNATKFAADGRPRRVGSAAGPHRRRTWARGDGDPETARCTPDVTPASPGGARAPTRDRSIVPRHAVGRRPGRSSGAVHRTAADAPLRPPSARWWPAVAPVP